MEHTRFVGLGYSQGNGSRSRVAEEADALVRWSTSARLPMIRVPSASCADRLGRPWQDRWRFIMRLEPCGLWRFIGNSKASAIGAM